MIKKSSFFYIKTKINKNISNTCENAQIKTILPFIIFENAQKRC